MYLCPFLISHHVSWTPSPDAAAPPAQQNFGDQAKEKQTQSSKILAKGKSSLICRVRFGTENNLRDQPREETTDLGFGTEMGVRSR